MKQRNWAQLSVGVTTIHDIKEELWSEEGREGS